MTTRAAANSGLLVIKCRPPGSCYPVRCADMNASTLRSCDESRFVLRSVHSPFPYVRSLRQCSSTSANIYLDR